MGLIILYLIIVCLLLGYILSCWGVYKFYHNAYYHVDGRWFAQNETISDIFDIFIPIFNTIITVEYFLGAWKHKNKKPNLIFFKEKI